MRSSLSRTDAPGVFALMTARRTRSPRVNRQFFKHLLQDRQLSQRQLAKLMDLDQSSLVRSFQGKRAFQTSEVTQLARILHVPLEEILKNLGEEAPPRLPKEGEEAVPVKGYISGSVVTFGKVPGPRAIPAPSNEPSAGLVALRYIDEGVFEGAYFYYRPGAGVQADAIGRLSVCAQVGGQMALANPKATGNGGYILRDVIGRILAENAWLESAHQVIWIKTS